MPLSSEVVYNGSDNPIALRFKVNGAVLADHSSITRVILELGKGDTILSADPYMTIDSSVDPDLFDLTEPAETLLALGAAGLSKGRHLASITIFLPAYPGGLSYGTVLEITTI